MDVNNVSSMLRSVLLSSKHPISINKLLQDYQLLIGSPIPFQELGFKSLLDYLQSIPDVVKLIRNSYGDVLCEAVSSSPTIHISNMVRHQKSDKKPPSHGHVPRHPSRRRPTPPKLPLARVSPPLLVSKPLKNTTTVVKPLLPTPPPPSLMSVPKPKYEIPPRFAKHATRSVQLSSHGLSVTINFGQNPPSSPTCPSSSSRHDNTDQQQQKVTNGTCQRKAKSTVPQASVNTQESSRRICGPEQIRKTIFQDTVHGETGETSVFQYGIAKSSDVHIVPNRKTEQRSRRTGGSKMRSGRPQS